MGDTTVHGGVIVIGAPNVIIGEIGSGGASGAAGAGAIFAGVVAAAPEIGTLDWIAQFSKSLAWDNTLLPIGEMVLHPVLTAEGIGTAIRHPIVTGEAIGEVLSKDYSGAAAGDPKAAGALGSVALLLVPGLGEAELAEDASKLSRASEIAGLKAKYATTVESLETYKTLGVPVEDAKGFLTTSEGQEYLSQLQKTDPSATFSILEQRAIQQIRSGSVLPQMTTMTDPLIKIVPKGSEVSAFTPFFTTPDAFADAVASGKPLGDAFGLPLKSQSTMYDVFAIEPPSGGANVFSTPIAPTRELNGLFQTNGEAIQTLVPSREGWSDPSHLGSISDERP